MYVKAKNGKVEAFPYGFGELMRDNPNTSFPDRMPDEALARFDIYPVDMQEIPQPFDNITQNATVVNPTLTDGKWVQTWDITPASASEVSQRLGDLAQNARGTRTALLAETDWSALTDNTLSTEMAVYRQALRDITHQGGFPRNIIWPVKPK